MPAPPSWRRKSHSTAGGGRQRASLAGRHFTSPPPSALRLSPPVRDPGDTSHRHHCPHPCHPGLDLSLGQVQPRRQRNGGDDGHPSGCGEVSRGPGMRKVGTGGAGKKAGKQAGQTVPVTGAILGEPCLAGTCLHHPQSQGTPSPPLSLWVPNPPPGPPHHTQPWTGTNLSLLPPPWHFSPGGLTSSPRWGCPGLPGGATFDGLCCASPSGERPAWPVLGTAPLPAEPRRAGTAPSTPRCTSRAAATPARGEKPPGQSRLRLRLPASIPSPAGLGGMKKQ